MSGRTGAAGQGLDDELVVCMRIYEYNIRGEPVWFSRLCGSLAGAMAPAAVSRCIDHLVDQGMVDEGWERDEGTGLMARSYRVSDRFQGFMEGLRGSLEAPRPAHVPPDSTYL